MQAQGTSPVNTSYFDSAISTINGINVCSDLQSVVTNIGGSLNAEITAINAQIAALLPLLSIPHDLGSVISWITAAIAPHQTAYNNLLAQITAIGAQVSALESAITAAAARITHCSISIPSIAV